MISKTLALMFAGSLMLAASPAGATITVYNAQLSGANENPANASPGTGFAIVTIDDVLNTMRVQEFFSGLIGTTTASHIHCCAPEGSNVGVATQLPSFPAFPTGVTSGTYDNTFDMTLTSSFGASFLAANGGTADSAFDALIAGLNAGDAYLNIHTTAYPGGEIRGQLAAIPEASTWMLLVTGFGAMGVALRRRRRSVSIRRKLAA
jgi:hypothetical protein